MALSVLVKRRILQQYLLYTFSYRLVRWLLVRVRKLMKRYKDVKRRVGKRIWSPFYKVVRNLIYNNRSRGRGKHVDSISSARRNVCGITRRFDKSLAKKWFLGHAWFTRLIGRLLRTFSLVSYRRINESIRHCISGLSTTILLKARKGLILSRLRYALRPSVIYVRWYEKKMFLNLPYISYNNPSRYWLARYFQHARSRYRYKASHLPLFASLSTIGGFSLRKRRRKRGRRFTRYKTLHLNIVKEPFPLRKEPWLRDNITPGPAIGAELYLKYFYDYSINELH